MTKETRYNSYQEIIDVARKYYNDSNCCTVVALSIVAKIGYGKAFNTYKKLGRRDRCGTHRGQQQAALKAQGLRMILDLGATLTIGKTLVTAARNAHRLPKGDYFVYSSRHVSAIRDGEMVDWGAERSRKRVQAVYRVIPITE